MKNIQKRKKNIAKNVKNTGKIQILEKNKAKEKNSIIKIQTQYKKIVTL